MSFIRNPAAAFLVAAGGNYRNAVYIDCGDCIAASKDHLGFLMVPGVDAKPVLVSVKDLADQLGYGIEKDECAATLSQVQFEKLYDAYLTWAVDEGGVCFLGWLAKCTCRNY